MNIYNTYKSAKFENQYRKSVQLKSSKLTLLSNVIGA